MVKPNKKNNLRSKSQSQWVEYLNIKSMQMEPANDAFFHRKAIELVTWAKENDQAFYIEQFCNLMDILECTYYDWVKKYPVMKNAHDAALQYLSIRNELYLREKDPASLKYIMPQISKRWLKEDERRAEQKIKLASKVQPFNAPSQEDLNFK